MSRVVQGELLRDDSTAIYDLRFTIYDLWPFCSFQVPQGLVNFPQLVRGEFLAAESHAVVESGYCESLPRAEV